MLLNSLLFHTVWYSMCGFKVRSGTGVTKGLGVHDPNLVKIIFALILINVNSNEPIRS